MSHFFNRAPRRIIALSLFAACSALSAAGAAVADEVPSTTVKYGDLNLGTDAGVHALYGRLVRAADRVCHVEFNVDLQTRQRALECREAAIARAVAALGNPRLVALRAAHARLG
jgi:UrcA family protein